MSCKERSTSFLVAWARLDTSAPCRSLFRIAHTRNHRVHSVRMIAICHRRLVCALFCAELIRRELNTSWRRSHSTLTRPWNMWSHPMSFCCRMRRRYSGGYELGTRTNGANDVSVWWNQPEIAEQRIRRNTDYSSSSSLLYNLLQSTVSMHAGCAVYCRYVHILVIYIYTMLIIVL